MYGRMTTAGLNRDTGAQGPHGSTKRRTAAVDRRDGSGIGDGGRGSNVNRGSGAC